MKGKTEEKVIDDLLKNMVKEAKDFITETLSEPLNPLGTKQASLRKREVKIRKKVEAMACIVETYNRREKFIGEVVSFWWQEFAEAKKRMV